MTAATKRRLDGRRILLTGAASGIGRATAESLARPAEPAEIAEAILFLTADASSFITGVTLAVDGGRTFH